MGKNSQLLKKYVERLRQTRLMRAVNRYDAVRGYLLAGGVAYAGLTSIFAGLAVTWTIFMSLLGSYSQLRTAVIRGINTYLPGVLDVGHGGLIKPESLLLNKGSAPASILAILVLAWAALYIMTALRYSVQAMFGINYLCENFVWGKLRDLCGFVVLTVGVLLASALTMINTWASDEVFQLRGFAAKLGLRFGIWLISALIGWLLIIFIIRVVAGARPYHFDLWFGSLPGALIIGSLALLGTTVVNKTAHNPLYAGFAAVLTIVLWVNLVVRVVLYTAAFVANPPYPNYPDSACDIHNYERPNFVTLSAKHTLDWEHDPLTGNIVPPREN